MKNQRDYSNIDREISDEDESFDMVEKAGSIDVSWTHIDNERDSSQEDDSSSWSWQHIPPQTQKHNTPALVFVQQEECSDEGEGEVHDMDSKTDEVLALSQHLHASALEDSTETDEKQKGSNGMTDAKEHLSDTCNAFTAPEANARDATARIDDTEMLSSSFAPPENLVYSLHGTLEEGNELGKLGRRLVLVSLQDYSSSFGSCIINRDVFGDGLIQDLIKSKFIFLQLTIDSIEGQIYADRFHVRSFPHIGVIHPRHGSFIWGKEGWNENSPWDLTEIVKSMTDLCFERYSEDHFAMCIDSGTLDFFDLGDRDALLR
mmetsp:Transcript_12906/g.20012  ORF Transcript_12906/g.20012 Transcript_12906/m.20012 type:complete len:318 (-) Transcript_12906:596-1549(-)